MIFFFFFKFFIGSFLTYRQDRVLIIVGPMFGIHFFFLVSYISHGGFFDLNEIIRDFGSSGLLITLAKGSLPTLLI